MNELWAVACVVKGTLAVKKPTKLNQRFTLLKEKSLILIELPS